MNCSGSIGSFDPISARYLIASSIVVATAPSRLVMVRMVQDSVSAICLVSSFFTVLPKPT